MGVKVTKQTEMELIVMNLKCETKAFLKCLVNVIRISFVKF